MKKEVFESVKDAELSQGKDSEINSEKTSITEAKSFWDTVFAEKDEEISEEKLWSDMHNRAESEFDFTDVVSDDAKNVLELFTEDRWECLDDDGRYELISKLAECIGKSLGLEKIPDIVLYALDDNISGLYNEGERYIGINTNYWDDYKDIVDTLAHEMRHAYQRYRADKLENYQDELYKFNFDNYISVDYDENGKCVNYLDYQGQYIEVEARAYAKEFAAEVV